MYVLQITLNIAWMDLMKALHIVMLEFVRKITFSATIDAVYHLIKLVWTALIYLQSAVTIISDVQLDNASS